MEDPCLRSLSIQTPGRADSKITKIPIFGAGIFQPCPQPVSAVRENTNHPSQLPRPLPGGLGYSPIPAYVTLTLHLNGTLSISLTRMAWLCLLPINLRGEHITGGIRNIYHEKEKLKSHFLLAAQWETACQGQAGLPVCSLGASSTDSTSQPYWRLPRKDKHLRVPELRDKEINCSLSSQLPPQCSLPSTGTPKP